MSQCSYGDSDPASGMLRRCQNNGRYMDGTLGLWWCGIHAPPGNALRAIDVMMVVRLTSELLDVVEQGDLFTDEVDSSATLVFRTKLANRLNQLRIDLRGITGRKVDKEESVS